MTFVQPCHSRGEVRRAGETLVRASATVEEQQAATMILTNWRASHGYLMNTFQSTLRNKLQRIDKTAIVGQRLKRAPSVIAKLKRYDTMQLQQMQDIAGLRAIVETNPKLKRLHVAYLNSRFAHELIKTHDYVNTPKPDGYRSIHLVYRYANPRAPAYNGLFLELQLRTRVQHAWATAVETVDAFLGESIKAGNPTKEWAKFFKLASAAFSIVEKAPTAPELATVLPSDIYIQLKQVEKQLQVRAKLRGFSVAADHIVKDGRTSASYHLIILDLTNRKLSIKSFPLAEQDLANRAYAEAEALAKSGVLIDPVLVTGGSVDGLRKAYPNYFLDTQAFVARLDRILSGPAFK